MTDEQCVYLLVICIILLSLHSTFSAFHHRVVGAWNTSSTFHSTIQGPVSTTAPGPLPIFTSFSFLVQLLSMFGPSIVHWSTNALYTYVRHAISHHFILRAGMLLYPWVWGFDILISYLVLPLPTTSIISLWPSPSLFDTKYAGRRIRRSSLPTKARARHHIFKLRNFWMLYSTAATSALSSAKVLRQHHIHTKAQHRSRYLQLRFSGPWQHPEWKSLSPLERRRLWIQHHSCIPIFEPGETASSGHDMCRLSFPFSALDDFITVFDPSSLGQVSGLFQSSSSSLLPADFTKGQPCHTVTLPRSHFVTPSTFRFYHTSTADDVPIIIDSGASISLTPFRSDFISFVEERGSLQAVGSSQEVQGSGLVEWVITNMEGAKVTIRTRALLCTSTDIRLLSPQSMFEEQKCGDLHLNADTVTISCKTMFKPTLLFPIQAGCNLTIMLLSNHPSFLRSLNYMMNISVASDPGISFVPEPHPTLSHHGQLRASLIQSSESNLTPQQQELLSWHWKFGHVFMRRIQSMLHHSRELDNNATDAELCHPVVVRSKLAGTRSCEAPQCTACNLSKSTRRSTNSSHGSLDPEKSSHCLKAIFLLVIVSQWINLL